MAEVITRENRAYYSDLIDDMHQQRYNALFRRHPDHPYGLGWDASEANIQEGFDKDDFDTDDTIYLVERHPDTGEILASIRYNPTTKPHLLSEVFAEHCRDGVVRDHRVWEVSRLVYDFQRMSKEYFDGYVRPRFRAAQTQLCYNSGFIDAVTWLCPEKLYTSTLSVWPNTIPLGLPKSHSDGKAYIAARSEMDAAAIRVTTQGLVDAGFRADEQVLFHMNVGLGETFARIAA